MARITSRLLIFTLVLLGLLYLLFHTASYGLSREAQFDALHQRLGSSTHDDVDENEQTRLSEEDLTPERPVTPPKQLPPQPQAQAHEESKHTTVVVQADPHGRPLEAEAAAATPHSTHPAAPPPVHDAPRPAEGVGKVTTALVLDSPPTASLVIPPSASSTTSASSLPTPSVYTRALVVARIKKEIPGTGWLAEVTKDDPNLRVLPYTVDDPDAEYTVPTNKGHESMVFLTYIIDHYDEDDFPFPDVSLFMHASKITWHNNDLLDSSSVNIVKHLSTPKVLRDGYFNLRCHLDPGCPAHLHPNVGVMDPHRPEETEIVNVWPILFPNEPIPDVLSQPCCSQFALSRDRILSLPKSQYENLRNWLTTTPLHDIITGRIMEYVWQKIWTGMNEFCPSEHVCYCDGYGLCFGNQTNFDLWFTRRKEFRELAPKLQVYVKKQEEDPQGDWMHSEEALEYRHRMEEIRDVLAVTREEAIERGRNPKLRSEEVGRDMVEGTWVF